MKKRRFVLTAILRDRMLVTGVLVVFFLCGVVVKEELARMYLLTVSAALALMISFLYIITNRPLPPKEVRGEIILNCIIVIAMTNFIYKIMYVY